MDSRLLLFFFTTISGSETPAPESSDSRRRTGSAASTRMVMPQAIGVSRLQADDAARESQSGLHLPEPARKTLTHPGLYPTCGTPKTNALWEAAAPLLRHQWMHLAGCVHAYCDEVGSKLLAHRLRKTRRLLARHRQGFAYLLLCTQELGGLRVPAARHILRPLPPSAATPMPHRRVPKPSVAAHLRAMWPRAAPRPQTSPWPLPTPQTAPYLPGHSTAEIPASHSHALACSSPHSARAHHQHSRPVVATSLPSPASSPVP